MDDIEDRKDKILTYELIDDETINIVYENYVKKIKQDKININKHDINREKILKIYQVNDNSLMVITSCDNIIYYEDIYVGEYYYDSKIHKNYAGRIKTEEFLSGECVHINDDNSALAIFSLPNSKGKQTIESFYDFKEHSSGYPEFLDCHYNKAFQNHEVDMEFILKK